MKKRKSHSIHIVIVGAGASGLTAAISAAREGARVTVIEQKEKVGKKILATGNGHCNFTNRRMDPSCYHGNAFAMHLIEQFDVDRTLAFFGELGIFPHERNGYYYPASEQASSVADLLEREAKKLGVSFLLDTNVLSIGFSSAFQLEVCTAVKSKVKEIVKKNGKKKITAGEIHYEKNRLTADRVILACGGMASPTLGSDGSGYRLASSLGHQIVTPLPALTGIQCKEEWFRKLAGVRISAEITIFADGKPLASDIGEVQLTEYGISGIPAFQVSRYAAKALAKGQNVKANLCFYPEISEDQLLLYLRSHGEEQYGGLYPEKLLSVLKSFLKEEEKNSSEMNRSETSARRLCHFTRHLLCTCTAVNGFERAQVTCGGVSFDQVDPDTLESQVCLGLYFAGELLDVDGICGGYNLQWAWSSGWMAGYDAAVKGKSTIVDGHNNRGKR